MLFQSCLKDFPGLLAENRPEQGPDSPQKRPCSGDSDLWRHKRQFFHRIISVSVASMWSTGALTHTRKDRNTTTGSGQTMHRVNLSTIVPMTRRGSWAFASP